MSDFGETGRRTNECRRALITTIVDATERLTADTKAAIDRLIDAAKSEGAEAVYDAADRARREVLTRRC